MFLDWTGTVGRIGKALLANTQQAALAGLPHWQAALARFLYWQAALANCRIGGPHWPGCDWQAALAKLLKPLHLYSMLIYPTHLRLWTGLHQNDCCQCG